MKTTLCKLCKKPIQYTTKPPTTCNPCKEKNIKKKKARRRFPKKQNTKGELYLFAVLDTVLPHHIYINHGFYSFLKSPKGAPLQLDRYYPDLKLAFEYDGEQHFSYVPYIHKSIQNFHYLQECDKLKKEICKNMGITLISVSYKHKINNEAIKIDIQKANPTLYKQLFQ